jgi:16S rRNA (cytidine1402-2'-O)-methyltransferase
MLHVCPTPIGNLGDVTLRVLEVLKAVDVVACEDTRRTRVLLDRYDISARVISFHGHNEEERVAFLLPRLLAGEEVALVSDAGMPGLSDPGFSLVRACVAQGVAVTVLPGPSAVSTALVLSAMPTDRFAFVGFLARTKAKLLEQLDRFEGTGAALVAFESPRRVKASLEAIAGRWPERQVVVCRELTKIHEEALRGTAAEVIDKLADPVRGEIVMVLAPAAPSGGVPLGRGGAGRQAAPAGGDLEQRALEALAELTALGVGTKKAATIVAGLTGLSTRRAYALALQVRGSGALLE